MSLFSLSVLGIVFSSVFAFVVFHVIRWMLAMVNTWRVKRDYKPFGERAVFLLSLCCALSFVF